jgi:hypothetical protein
MSEVGEDAPTHRRWSQADSPEGVHRTKVPEQQGRALGGAYTALARPPAALRASRGGDVPVSFGETAAAKALFAIRPLAVPPRDEPMRRAAGAAWTLRGTQRSWLRCKPAYAIGRPRDDDHQGESLCAPACDVLDGLRDPGPVVLN